MRILRRFILILIVVQLTMPRSAVLAHDPKKEAVKPASPKAGTQETSVIIVNERVLVGTNSAPQIRGGRLFLPIATIAEALGDTFSSDSTQRMVTIRRQDGIVAIFNAPLNEVRENGAVILTLSGSADLVFPPTPNELMLPAEIVAALLDVTIRRDENNAIVVTRKGVHAETIRSGAKHAPWETFRSNTITTTVATRQRAIIVWCSTAQVVWAMQG